MTRAEWLAWRKPGIGSSDAAAIMGFSKWSTPFELFLEKTGRIVGRRRMAWEWRAMERGRRLEPFAREAYEARLGFPMPPACVIHSTLPWLRASLDGMNLEHEALAEFKGPGKEDHEKALRGEITEYGLWQCTHAMLVTGFDWIDFGSYRDDELAPCLRTYRDFKREKDLFEAEKEMWERIQTDSPPFSPNCRRVSREPKVYRRKSNGREVLYRA